MAGDTSVVVAVVGKVVDTDMSVSEGCSLAGQGLATLSTPMVEEAVVEDMEEGME